MNPKFFLYQNSDDDCGSNTYECVVEVPGKSSGFPTQLDVPKFLNRCHVRLELENEEATELWKKKRPYLLFELRRSKIGQ